MRVVGSCPDDTACVVPLDRVPGQSYGTSRIRHLFGLLSRAIEGAWNEPLQAVHQVLVGPAWPDRAQKSESSAERIPRGVRT